MDVCVAVLLVAIVMLCAGSQVRSDASDHRYRAGDSVPLYASKVGPFQNPSEVYSYYDLPFCSPVPVTEKKEPLVSMLKAERLFSAPYKLNFLVNKNDEVLCRKKLSKEEVSKFLFAIKKDCYVKMYCDDLPVWSFLGQAVMPQINGSRKYFLFLHNEFDVFYNKDRVVEVSLRVDVQSKVELAEGREVAAEFRYTVRWKETSTPFEKRLEKYSTSSFLPRHLNTHWFSIKNSCAAALLLTGFLVAYYLRVLKTDFIKYSQDEESAEDEERTGWKYIHGDVFRYPKHKSLFAAALGCGTQLLILTISILVVALFGVFRPYKRGALFTALVVLYAITSWIAGYVAASFYCQFGGTNWVRNLSLTAFLFSGPLFLAFCFLNTLAILHGSIAALPISTIVAVVLTWLFVAAPFLLLGGCIGKNRNADFQAPCRTTGCPRDVPSLRWHRGTLPQMSIAGIVPFGVIYVELYYILGSLWGHRSYHIYGILFVVFAILLVVTASVTIALTHFQLAAEDHRWWWRSFLCGGSAAVFTYGYCFFYYYARSDMSGVLQTSFFFCYMACISYGIFLMLGSVGFSASLLFVRHIYGSIKCD